MVPDQPYEGLLACREPLRKFVLSVTVFRRRSLRAACKVKIV
jgi:hypothetical protein